MQLWIGGGCGDFGRNCFYIEGADHAFIVDAGTSTDGTDDVPDLTAEQLRRADYIFLTHSHRDHTGAVEYFEDNGFDGVVTMTNQTYQQLRTKPRKIMILDSTAPELELDHAFSFRWGRTGHCAGSVWYYFSVEGKRIFFSGDYREGDPFYRSDPVRDIEADMAVLDAAYEGNTVAETLRCQAMEVLERLAEQGAVLLPVPRHGRGLSLALLAKDILGEDVPLYFSPNLLEQWCHIGHRPYFVTERALALPENAFSLWDERHIDKGLYFLTDAQLSREETRNLIDANPRMSVLLTGRVHGYGRAAEFVNSGRAVQVKWPNHMSVGEAKQLDSQNRFNHVVLFHNVQRKAGGKRISF